MTKIPKAEPFADCLVRLRNSHGMSQKALALTAQMDQAYLAGLETGRRPLPRDKQLLRLAAALNADQEEIAQLFTARAVSKITKIGVHIASPQSSSLTHLIAIAVNMTEDDISVLEQIAEALSSRRQPHEGKELRMGP